MEYLTFAVYAYQNYPQWRDYLKTNGPDITGRIKKITDAYSNIVEQQLPPGVKRVQLQELYENKRDELTDQIYDIIHRKQLNLNTESIATFLEQNPEVIELIRELMLNEAMYMGRDYEPIRDKKTGAIIREEPIDIYKKLPRSPNSYIYVLASILADPTPGGVDLTTGFTNVTDEELKQYIEELKYQYRQENKGTSDVYVSEKEREEFLRRKYLESIRNASPGSSLDSQDSLYENERSNDESDNIDYGIDYGADPFGIQERKRKSEDASNNGRKSRRTEGGRRTRKGRGRKGRGKARKTKRGRKQRRTKRR